MIDRRSAITGRSTTWRTRAHCALVAILGVVSFSSVAGAATRPQSKLTQVTIGIASPSITDVPMWVAQSKGIFAKDGMTITLVPLGNSASVAAAMAIGAIDFSLQSVYSVIESTASTLPFESISEYENALTVAAIVSASFAKAHKITSATPIATAVHSLVGSREGAIGSTPLSDGNVMLSYYGVSPNQIHQVNMASTTTELQGLQSGSINWFVGQELVAFQAASSGHGVVIASNENAPPWSAQQLSVVLAANTNFANHHASLTSRLVAAVNTAVAYTSKNLSSVLPIAEAHLPGYSAAVIMRSLRDSVWPASGKQNSTLWATSLNFSIRSGLLPYGTSVKQGSTWTNKFIAS